MSGGEPPGNITRQTAYAELEDKMSWAEDLADESPDNVDKLREAFTEAENLLTRLDDVEYRLIQAIKTGEMNRPYDTDTERGESDA